MNNNFIQLLCWLMAYEITSDDGERNKHQRTYNNIYDFVRRNFMTKTESETCSNNFDDHKEMGNKFIKIYYSLPAKDSEKLTDQLEDIKIGRDLKIKKLIGEGSFGYAFEVIHIIDNERYAIKMIQLKGNEIIVIHN